jgi:hypothetical protein
MPFWGQNIEKVKKGGKMEKKMENGEDQWKLGRKRVKYIQIVDK